MHWKLHVLFTSLIVVGMIGAVLLLQKKPEEIAVVPLSEYFIQIVDATWGANCESILQRQREKQVWNAKKKLPASIQRNNVLRAVSRLCNGKETCSFRVDVATLGDDPAPGCRKNFELKYRCFEIDRSRPVAASDNHEVTIDCKAAPLPQNML